MRDRLILLPGWGLGCMPLEPLVAALHELDPWLKVQIEPLPELHSSDPHQWISELDERLPQDCWLGGWSLGGMLAAELAGRRGERCCGLMALGSNACFVARDDWPDAMPALTFQNFRDSCASDSQQTLKRFALLCTQGAQSRALARQLTLSAPQANASALLHALDLLATLDTRAALQAFTGPQLHLLAGADALVPAEAALALLALLGDIEVSLMENLSHAFVLERPHEVAAAILAFIHEVEDD
jgi:pimeloyl-[acyl-carrier protein] methyl ester esterase